MTRIHRPQHHKLRNVPISPNNTTTTYKRPALNIDSTDVASNTTTIITTSTTNPSIPQYQYQPNQLRPSFRTLFICYRGQSHATELTSLETHLRSLRRSMLGPLSAVCHDFCRGECALERQLRRVVAGRDGMGWEVWIEYWVAMGGRG